MAKFIEDYGLTPEEEEEAEVCQRCEKRRAEKMHRCPYQHEVNDVIELCNCCDDCRQERFEDI